MVAKFAFQLTGTFNLDENRSYFRTADENDHTANYGANPNEVLVFKENNYWDMDAHRVISGYPDGDEDFSEAMAELATITPLSEFDVWNQREEYISDMIHPLHVMLLYHQFVTGNREKEMLRSIAYWGSFERWICNEIYWMMNECELDYNKFYNHRGYDEDDIARYVNQCIRLYNKYIGKDSLAEYVFKIQQEDQHFEHKHESATPIVEDAGYQWELLADEVLCIWAWYGQAEPEDLVSFALRHDLSLIQHTPKMVEELKETIKLYYPENYDFDSSFSFVFCK